MIRTLTKIFSLNFGGSVINFITTILIVKTFGIKVFGNFAIVSAYVGLLTLVYILVPPSYATFKLQDDKDFIDILFFNYIFASVLVSIFVIVIFHHFVIDINIFLVILYVISLGILNFFDVYFKATNALDRYFYLLFLTLFIPKIERLR